MFAGWVNRHQLDVIEYLQEENRVLKERLGGRRLRFSNAERCRLARKAQMLGRKVLNELETLVTPDTLLRSYRDSLGPNGITVTGVIQVGRASDSPSFALPPGSVDCSSFATASMTASDAAASRWRSARCAIRGTIRQRKMRARACWSVMSPAPKNSAQVSSTGSTRGGDSSSHRDSRPTVCREDSQSTGCLVRFARPHKYVFRCCARLGRRSTTNQPCPLRRATSQQARPSCQTARCQTGYSTG
jgi:hypothetical protein